MDKITFKYIIVSTGAILFNEQTVHAIVAEGFKVLGSKIFSAGFVTVGPGIVECYGESTSLKIKSVPEIDKILIADLFAPVSQIKYFGLDVAELYK